MSQNRLFSTDYTPTRFETTLELHPIALILKKMRDKESELSKTTSEKHTVISFLLSQLDNVIAEFNEKQLTNDHHENIKDVLYLLQEFKAPVADILKNDSKKLSVNRNSNKDLVNLGKAATPAAAVGGAVGLGLLTGATGGIVLAGAALGGFAYYCSSSTTPDTLLLVKELNDAVNRIHNSLQHMTNRHCCRK